MANPINTKFKVSNRKSFLKTINPSSTLERNIGKACADVADQLLKKIRKAKNAPKYKSYFSVSHENIYSNIELVKENNIDFTVTVLNTFLCFFFYKKPPNYKFTEQHTELDLRNFFNHIKITNVKNVDIDAFHNFLEDLELIKENLNFLFNDFTYEIDSSFNFSMLKNNTNETDNQYNFPNEKTNQNNLSIELKNQNHINISIENKNIIKKKKKLEVETVTKSFFQKYSTIPFIFLILVFFGIGYYSLILNEDSSPIIIKNNQNCIFPDSDKYKILIIPFENRLNIDGIQKNIGVEIEERLDYLNKVDTLNIEVHYCYDFIFDKSIKDKDDFDYFKRVMNESNADHIIYGALQDTDYIDLANVRINYISNPKIELENHIEFDDNIQFNQINLSDVSSGVLLGNIEYLIYLNTAISLFNSKNYKKAHLYLDAIKDEGIDKRDWLELKTLCFINQHNTNDALLYINKILERDMPKDDYLAKALFIKGFIEFMNHNDIAIDYFNKSISINPDSSISHYYKALHLWYERGDLDTSIKNFDMAIELEKDKLNLSSLYNSKGRVYFINQLYIDAINSINQAIEIAENSLYKIDKSSLYLNKALSLYYLKEYDESLKVLDKVLIENNSDNKKMDVFLWKARNYDYVHKHELASDFYKKALIITPCDREAFNNVAKQFYNKKEFNKLGAMVDKCYHKNVNDYHLLYYKSKMLYHLDSVKEGNKIKILLGKISPTTDYHYHYGHSNQDSTLLKIIPKYDSLSGKDPIIYLYHDKKHID